MKTRILFCMVSVAILGAGLAIINACSKTENPEKSNDFSVQNLSALNNYRPDKGEIADLYHQFLSEIKLTKENTSYKDLIEAVDRPVDEAVWLIETAVNTELGFYADSIEKTEELTVEITLENISYTTGGIPIIDGNEILQEYLEIEGSILENKENGYLFWCGEMKIIEVNSQNTIVEIMMIGGDEGGDAHYYTPLPPGTQIDPFPPDTGTIPECPAVGCNMPSGIFIIRPAHRGLSGQRLGILLSFLTVSTKVHILVLRIAMTGCSRTMARQKLMYLILL